MINKFGSMKFFLFYLCISIFYTFPLLLIGNQFLIGHGGFDAFAYMWNTHTFWENITHLQTPFYTRDVFYPLGANLLFSDSSPLVSFFGFLFLRLPVLYINLVVVIGLTFSAFFCFLLVRKITQLNSYLSFLCGLVYGFSPTLWSFIEVQHNYYLIASAFLPLSLLLLVSFLEQPQRYLKRFIIVQFLFFFTNYYFFILNGFINVLFISIFLVTQKELRNTLLSYTNRAYCRSAVILFIVCISITGFILFMNFSGWSGLAKEGGNYAARCNANLAGIILLRSTMQKLGYSENGDTPVYYVGLVFLILAVCALFLCWRHKYVLPITVSLLMVFFLSLGLEVRFGDYVIAKDSLTPFYYLAKLPGLGLIDCPIRFMAAVHLFLALLIGVLLKQLFQPHRKLVWLIVFVCILSFFSDYSIGKFSFVEVTVPDTYRYLEEQKDGRTVLELSSGLTESKGGFGYDYSIEGLHTRQMYWQTLYNKPRIGGYISRIPDETYDYFKSELILGDIFRMTSYQGEWPGRTFTTDEVTAFLSRFNLGYIVIAPTNRQNLYRQTVEKLLFGIRYEKTEDSAHYILYELSDN